MTFLDVLDGRLIGRVAARPAWVDGRLRTHAWSTRTFAALATLLFASCAIAYARWRIAGDVVPWDSKNHFFPMFRFLGDALRQGTIPLWNPYHFGGYPAAADPQSLLFTPSMVLFALVAPDASMATFDAVIFAHLAAGGIGMLGLARRWRWQPAGGFLTALVFMLGGAASSRLQHTGMIISYGFFPLALWSLEAALDRRSRRLALVAGLFVTLMALGRDQVAFLLCLTTAGFVLWKAARADDPMAYVRTRAPVLAVAGFVTIALMATPVLLTLQFIRDSNRPGFAYGRALEGSLDPANLATLISANIFGSLDRIYDYWGPGPASAAGNDITDRSMNYLFVGTLPIVLVFWHGIAGRRLGERGIRFAAVLLVFALLYALGRYTPAFSIIFDWMPAVSLYRRPADATFILNIALAFGGGYLLSRFVESGLPDLRPARMWISLLLALVGAAAIVGLGLAFAQDEHHLDASLRCLGFSCALSAATALLMWLGRAPRHRALLASALVAMTAGQLLWRNADSALNGEATRIYGVFENMPPDQAKGLAVLRAEIEASQAQGERPRVEIFGLDGPWQNAAMVLKLEDTLGYNPLRIATYEKAVGVTENSNDLMKRDFPGTFRGYNSRLAGLLGLDYLVLDRAIEDLPRQIPRPHATLLFGGKGFFVYRLDGRAVPRTYVATKVLPVDTPNAIEHGMMPTFEIGREALIEGGDFDKIGVTATADGPPSEGASRADIVSYTDNAVRIDVDTSTNGVLVLHDIMYPGWTATVDGRSVPILRTNLLFRGVEVPAGHHAVEFSFHPLSPGNLMAAASGLFRRKVE